MCRLMRKNDVILAMSAALLAACSNDVALDSAKQSAEVADNAISFQFINRNSITSRGEDTPANNDTNDRLLNNKGHYNFGVFAYKSTLSGTASFSLNSATKVMENYLVGYSCPDTETTKYGYKFGTDQTTLASSRWAYEKLGTGSGEYSYTGEDGYYKSSETFYMSNNANQYLKYWDLSTSQTDFFAYAPYLKGKNEGTTQNTAKVEEANSKTTISFPMTDGYDDASKYDFIAAHKKVEKSGYDKSVQIDFKRLSAMIRIGFYEQIDGYKVKILNLVEAKDGTSAVGVSAAPAIKSTENATTKYTYGTLYYKGTGTGTYPATDTTDDNIAVSVDGDDTNGKYSNQAGTTAPKYINFVIPEGDTSGGDNATHYISEAKATPSKSDTKYYLIPDNGTNKTGLTFHVTYQLIADDTNETITVYNATVHVPYEATVDNNKVQYCDWKSNYVYTYIFKITKGTSGNTDKPDNIDPSDPDADDKQALKPIIFDNCTVENWDETKSYEFDIK